MSHPHASASHVSQCILWMSELLAYVDVLALIPETFFLQSRYLHICVYFPHASLLISGLFLPLVL